MIDLIESKYNEAGQIRKILMKNKADIDFDFSLDDIYKKVIVLSSASLFEKKISNIIIRFAQERAPTDCRVATFVENKAVKRQYHTYFQWDGNNTNSFWGLFGGDALKRAKESLNNNVDLKEAESNFLFIGKLRNTLVHNDFLSNNCLSTMTLDEIYAKYSSARQFVEFIPKILDLNSEIVNN